MEPVEQRRAEKAGADEEDRVVLHAVIAHQRGHPDHQRQHGGDDLEDRVKLRAALPGVAADKPISNAQHHANQQVDLNPAATQFAQNLIAHR